MLGLLVATLGVLGIVPAFAQSVPKDLRQPVALAVSGDSALVAPVRQLAQIYLIGAEARLVEDGAAWFVDLGITQAADGGAVGLSLVASQPLPPAPAKSPQLGEQDMTSGTWVLEFLNADRIRQARFIQQHEVVVVEPHALERGVATLIERFQAESLVPKRNLP